MSDDFNGGFDEISEIEKLQETIRNMSNNITDDSEGFLSQSPAALMGATSLGSGDDEDDPYAAIEKPVVRNSGPKAKKFVVMVNSNNVEFFDKIPMEERTKLFNTLLSDYQKSISFEKQKKHLIKFSKHMFVAILTILMSLPIMFVVVNKSVEMTINNYKDMSGNFEKLYDKRRQNSYTTPRRY